MGGHKQSLGGDGAPGLTVATALVTSTKKDTSVANFVTHGKKQQSDTLNQGCKFELKPQKSRLLCRTRENSVDYNLNQV